MRIAARAARAARPLRSALTQFTGVALRGLLAVVVGAELLAAGAGLVVVERRGPMLPAGARSVVAGVEGLHAVGPAQRFDPLLSLPVWASPLVLTRFYAGELTGWSRQYVDPATGQDVEIVVVQAGTGGAAASLVGRWAAAARGRGGRLQALDVGFPALIAAGGAVGGAGVTSDGAAFRRGRDMVLAVALPSLEVRTAVLAASAAEWAWLGRGSSTLDPPAGTPWLHDAGGLLAVAVLIVAGLLTATRRWDRGPGDRGPGDCGPGDRGPGDRSSLAAGASGPGRGAEG